MNKKIKELEKDTKEIMQKIFIKLIILLFFIQIHSHIIHEKPKIIHENKIIELQKKWTTHFTWTKYNFIHCSFIYENNKAGFAIFMGFIPLYCKNYRILPTIKELKSFFSYPFYFFDQPNQL